MKDRNESKTLKLEEFEIVEFQNLANSIKGGTGVICNVRITTWDDTTP